MRALMDFVVDAAACGKVDAEIAAGHEDITSRDDRRRRG
jgi:hypothetical protein